MLLISNLEYGGAQRQVMEIANHLNAERCHVHICCLSDYVPLAERLIDREHRLHVIRKYHKFDFTVVPRLARLLRRLKIDVVQGYLFDADIAARLAGRIAHTPVIISSERNTDYRLKKRQLVAFRLTRRCVDLVIANSNAGAAFNSRVLGMPPAMYRVVHNGVDTQRFSPRPQDGLRVRRELGIGDDESVVGMFASFKEQKNHPLFFAAARRIMERLPRVRFLLVGDMLAGGMHGSEQYKDRIDRLVDELGVRARCIFTGNQEQVEHFYNACDLTVLPSFFEGTANVLLESMACGVPVVATNVSDNAYIVPDGQVGHIISPGDENILVDRILRLLMIPELREQMGRRAREWVEREFSIPSLVRKTLAVYEEALADRRRRGTGKEHGQHDDE